MIQFVNLSSRYKTALPGSSKRRIGLHCPSEWQRICCIYGSRKTYLSKNATSMFPPDPSVKETEKSKPVTLSGGHVRFSDCYKA
ncbi:unnamed protein product [Hymenolepis diminuta]|uniref:Uncharacterized protein n=1 Tax=Hymenolepis diminuta TaxID=6216 RepID=A0A564YBI4_HYMDI|nr:unnamed protein product [Hymenolepis diminuta]